MTRHFALGHPGASFSLRDPSTAGFAALAADVLAMSGELRTAALER